MYKQTFYTSDTTGEFVENLMDNTDGRETPQRVRDLDRRTKLNIPYMRMFKITIEEIPYDSD